MRARAGDHYDDALKAIGAKGTGVFWIIVSEGRWVGAIA